jgi:hypothetical protein
MARTLDHTTRRQFLTTAATVVTGAALAACAEEDDGGADADCPEISVGSNHGHILEIPLEDIEAGETMTYTLEGTHEHTLEVDSLVFEKIKMDGSYTVPSSTTEGHSHLVEIILDPTCLPGD